MAMPRCTSYEAELQRHPATLSPLVRTVTVHVDWSNDNALAFSFTLEGDLGRLRIPASRPPQRANDLWRHTCFEAFLRGKGESTYYEFNFSPSREWAAYMFRRYRDSMAPVRDFDPCVVVNREDDRLELAASIRLDCLLQAQPGAGLQLALSAVVEDEHGVLSYWALSHPPGRPDFHHPDAFVLELQWTDAGLVSTPAEEEK